MSIIDVLLDGRIFLKTRETIERKIGILARRIILSCRKVDPYKIFIMTYDNSYTCNPSYIVDEISKRGLPVNIVYVIPRRGDMIGRNRVPANVSFVRRGTVEMFKEQASSKIWVDNALNCLWFSVPKKKTQVYINTWHGSLGIKKLSGNKHWLKIAKRCKKTTDYCVTNSKFEEDVFRSTFWPDTPFLKYGHARNDILFNKQREAEVRDNVRDYFKIERGIKIMLYAPTFRDDGDVQYLNLNYSSLKESLEKRFGGQWVILSRMHHKNKWVTSINANNDDWLLGATSYPNMQELLLAADAGLTDYSSWAYDFALARRPLFLYTPDLDNYDQERGFYYSIDSTPFPLAYTNEGLCENILKFDQAMYLNKVEEFLEEKGCYETGQAAKLVVDKIEELMGLNG